MNIDIAIAEKLPNFVIIGSMRCGTTSLAHYLRFHPQVFVPAKKELHYFDRNYEQGVDWYRAYFADVAGEGAVGEATPLYMYHRDVPPRMAALLPGARLIAILRNPVDRAYSHYWHSRIRGNETLGFVDAIAAEPQRLAGGDPRAYAAQSYFDRGRYLSQLQRFCQYYQREALLVILFEELRDQPAQVYRTICQFLGVDDTYLPADLGRAVNPAVSFRSLRVRNIAKKLAEHRTTFLIARVLARLNTKRSFSYPRLDPALRAKLIAEFEPENEALAAWLDRDLSIWRR